jgi:hypothetical protein
MQRNNKRKSNMAATNTALTDNAVAKHPKSMLQGASSETIYEAKNEEVTNGSDNASTLKYTNLSDINNLPNGTIVPFIMAGVLDEGMLTTVDVKGGSQAIKKRTLTLMAEDLKSSIFLTFWDAKAEVLSDCLGKVIVVRNARSNKYGVSVGKETIVEFLPHTKFAVKHPISTLLAVKESLESSHYTTMNVICSMQIQTISQKPTYDACILCRRIIREGVCSLCSGTESLKMFHFDLLLEDSTSKLVVKVFHDQAHLILSEKAEFYTSNPNLPGRYQTTLRIGNRKARLINVTPV